jgi:hypothetical protein
MPMLFLRPTPRRPATLRRKLASFCKKGNRATAHTPFHPHLPIATSKLPSTLRRKLASFCKKENRATAHTPFHPHQPTVTQLIT